MRYIASIISERAVRSVYVDCVSVVVICAEWTIGQNLKQRSLSQSLGICQSYRPPNVSAFVQTMLWLLNDRNNECELFSHSSMPR